MHILLASENELMKNESFDINKLIESESTVIQIRLLFSSFEFIFAREA